MLVAKSYHWVPGRAMFDGNEYGALYIGNPLPPIEFEKPPTSLASTDHPSIAVRESGASINRPYPPRRTILLPNRQANPIRGAKSFFEELRKPAGTPACAAVRIGVGAI